MSDTDYLRKYSSQVIDGIEAAPARAMLRAVGFTDDDFKKPQIGIASTWAMVTPCNMHIDKLALEVEKGANAAGAKGVIFNTITISDGIANGTEGMKYSLVSREVIADSIEVVVGCEGFDGLVTVGGCDKNMPGCLIGMARLNRPSIFVYGGTIRRAPATPTSFPCLRPSASMPAATSAKSRSSRSKTWRSPAPVPAAACTPPIPWPRPSKRWA
nr:dihydroxy-acid dehydratase [Pseudomonas reinekei]